MNRKRQHHYVWRKYLESWSSEGQVWCRRDGNTFKTATKNVAQERDFYMVRPHHPADGRLILELAGLATHPRARESNIAWATDLLNISSIIGYCESAANVSEEARREALKLASNIAEDIYSRAENAFIPFLQALCEGEISFARGDEKSLPAFYRFLAQQNLRTKRVKKRIAEGLSGSAFKDPANAWSILRHVLADNVGWSLYVERKSLRFVLYGATGSERFLTTDHPVINLAGTDDFTPPESLDLFYPVSPVYALRISTVGPSGTFCEGISDTEVKYFNRCLVENSLEFVISSSEEQLAAIAPNPSEPHS